jgi:hypothetical protein
MVWLQEEKLRSLSCLLWPIESKILIACKLGWRFKDGDLGCCWPNKKMNRWGMRVCCCSDVLQQSELWESEWRNSGGVVSYKHNNVSLPFCPSQSFTNCNFSYLYHSFLFLINRNISN